MIRLGDVAQYTRWLEDMLVEHEPDYICDELIEKDDWCRDHCSYTRPQAVCIRRYYEERKNE